MYYVARRKLLCPYDYEYCQNCGGVAHGIKVERLETSPSMPFLKEVKVKIMGNIIQIQAIENCNHYSVIQRLDNDTCLNKLTGEIGEICHMTNREQDKKSLARSMRELRGIINTNVIDTHRVRWVTLTYAENMTMHYLKDVMQDENLADAFQNPGYQG